MREDSYLTWLVNQTPTLWWHDSGDPEELDFALAHGASGVTTNPVLTAQALTAHPAAWRQRIDPTAVTGVAPADKVAGLMRAVAVAAAAELQAQHTAPSRLGTASQGDLGYVCAQVNPRDAGNREAMLAMARRFNDWAPNIAIKLPVTAAGLDVLETCIAEGIAVTATVSFTVPQVVAIAERHRSGAAQARAKGIKPGRCFAVIMIGRLDDYLRDVALDNRAAVTEADIRSAGLAVTKRAYALYQDRGYEATLLVAALRGVYHMTELAGARIIMSIHPKYQRLLLQPGVPREQRIDRPVDQDALNRLMALPEFVRAYEPDGMRPEDFIAYGATQRTLAQFDQAGWSALETFEPISGGA